MIAYIVTIHYHYEDSAQAEEPSKVYTDRAEAEAAAKALDGSYQSGEVWEIELPEPYGQGVRDAVELLRNSARLDPDVTTAQVEADADYIERELAGIPVDLSPEN